MRNVHRMFITYIHRTQESRNTKTLTTSLFRYETFYYLWVKRFFDIRREVQSFYAGFSICPPNTCGTRHKATGLASASKRKSAFYFGQQDSTNWLSSKSPKSYARASSAWPHSHPQVTIFYLGFLFWHMCTTHPPRARVNTCAQVST